MTKKQIRANFRYEVFKRDGYRCRECGKQYSIETAEIYLDAHHILNRNDMPNGGYVKENGISLCKYPEPGLVHSCHMSAELGIISAETLYRKIGSSYNAAKAASERLK